MSLASRRACNSVAVLSYVCLKFCTWARGHLIVDPTLYRLAKETKIYASLCRCPQLQGELLIRLRC